MWYIWAAFGIAVVILVIAMAAIVRAGHDEDSWYDGLQ
jgi:heme exporter protein D